METFQLKLKKTIHFSNIEDAAILLGAKHPSSFEGNRCFFIDSESMTAS